MDINTDKYKAFTKALIETQEAINILKELKCECIGDGFGCDRCNIIDEIKELQKDIRKVQFKK